MDDQTTMTTDTAAADSPGSDHSLPKGHRKVESDDYRVVFHPAFASACTVQKKGGAKEELYRQGTEAKDVVHCPEGHPERHEIHIRGKGNGRDIVITIHDPSHTLHSISFDLYKEARDRGKAKSSAQPLGVAAMQASDGASADVGETFTLENDAKTCPPYCNPTDPNNPT